VKGWVTPPESKGEFAANMERVLDVYKRPYEENNPVVCMDESPKQLISGGQSPIPLKPGQETRVDYKYIRHGMVNIFMANEPLKGNRLVEVTKRKTKKDWAKFIKRLADEQYPNAHTASAFYEVFEPEEAKKLWDRLEFVFTPKHGSWLNMAEIELHVLNRQCLNRHILTMDKVKQEINAWQDNRNKKRGSINWQFTTKDSRVKLKRPYPSIND